jgi:hypothetical protein
MRLDSVVVPKLHPMVQIDSSSQIHDPIVVSDLATLTSRLRLFVQSTNPDWALSTFCASPSTAIPFRHYLAASLPQYSANASSG